MPTANPSVQIRPTEEDLALIRAIGDHFGLPTRTATIRYALREFARDRGITAEAPGKKPKKSRTGG